MTAPNAETTSSISAFLKCPAQYRYKSKLKLRRIRSADALRLGGGFHAGLEYFHGAIMRGRSHTPELEAEAVNHATAGYEERPAWANPTDWEALRPPPLDVAVGQFADLGLVFVVMGTRTASLRRRTAAFSVSVARTSSTASIAPLMSTEHKRAFS